MASQMVDVHTPGLKWWLAHLENDFHPARSVDLFVEYLSSSTVLSTASANRLAVRSSAAPSATPRPPPSEPPSSSSA